MCHGTGAGVGGGAWDIVRGPSMRIIGALCLAVFQRASIQLFERWRS
jgi:hypothetical protein